MGNLLGAPVTEKETHVGTTPDGLNYGVSSMQGWRVHMEDAHITEGQLYASAVVVDEATNEMKYNKIDLPGHSLFAVFDGHGGTFAAVYAGRNFCRVLSRQSKFVQYAKFVTERQSIEETMQNPSDREDYIQSGRGLLEEALGNAFTELDKEIACALRGERVPDADVPYLEAYNRSTHINGNNNTVAGGNDAAPSDAVSQQLLDEEGDSGTTACVVLLTPEWVVCANAGDSRAVISRLGNKAVPLSYDHKPDDEAEERRIRTAGGYVAGGRVEGDLAVSRGLGDFRFKNMNVVMAVPFSGVSSFNNNGNAVMSSGGEGTADASSTEQQQPPSPPTTTMKPGDQKVSPVPDILVQNRNQSQDEFIIVACDGIWDVQTNYEAVRTLADMFQEGEANLGLICEEFCDIGLSMGSKDNMTVLVVKLAAQKIGEGGGVLARRQLRDSEGGDSGSKS